MKSVIVIIAGLLSLFSSLPYVIDIAKNKTHPNLVTWITWMAVSGINTAAALSSKSIHTAILSGAVVLTDAAIVVMGLKRGVKKYTLFDLVCQLLALIGLILWLETGKPSLAVALSLGVILIAALPTWRHAYIKPFEETWQGFAIGAVSGILTLFSLSRFSFIALAFPVALVINCSILVTIILLRRRSNLTNSEVG